ncbi:MAG: acetyl-CoA carboxylase biotin carboxylase subunit [Gemmatimonadota bacterium]
MLVANRGEIALRVVRACHDLGVPAVAVFSDADRTAPHVLAAAEARHLGASPASESYLRGDAIIAAARESGCDAVHPGYGFLAENAAFAQAVADAGLIFVGPPAAAIAAMGDKTEARRRMAQVGVPVVPGTVEPLEDPDAAAEAAREVGYPVLIKAVGGGGGKGMRVVGASEELADAFRAARAEAVAAFGDGRVYLERFLQGPRHIEIQVLADAHGAVVHLGERECSIQRRHQKLVEEAPSGVLSAAQRKEMGGAAVAAARAVGYASAGTVEFLWVDGRFYFLEMNTRLQVEHPVTEFVTGIDLVEWQLRVAAGERLPFEQEDIRLRGHAIECRITSEDPRHGFLPSTGVVRHLQVPAGPGVRWDGGIARGQEVTLHYDPLLGKLIAHAPTREAAIARMSRALAELRIVGVDTSVPFHRALMDHPEFRAGDLDIGFLEHHGEELGLGPDGDGRDEAIAVTAALAEHRRRRRTAVRRVDGAGRSGSRWRDLGWR